MTIRDIEKVVIKLSEQKLVASAWFLKFNAKHGTGSLKKMLNWILRMITAKNYEAFR